jgi:hypothetical protein
MAITGNNCWGTPVWVPTSRFSVSSVGAPLAGALAPMQWLPRCRGARSEYLQKGTHAGVPQQHEKFRAK